MKGQYMTYIDCYLVPVSSEKRTAYEELAQLTAIVAKEHGALRVVACWLDASGPDASSYHAEDARLETEEYGSFFRAAGAEQAEVVALSYIEWPDKETRDAGMAKFTSDSRMQFQGRLPVFDGKRLIAGGFIPMLPAPRDA